MYARCPTEVQMPQATSDYWFLHSNYLGQIKTTVIAADRNYLDALVLKVWISPTETKELSGEVLARDGMALSKGANEADYKGLETRIVGHLNGYFRDDPHQSVSRNSMIDVVLSTLIDYPVLLQEKFDIDLSKAKRLKIAGLLALERHQIFKLVLGNNPELNALYQQILEERTAILRAKIFND